MTSVNKQFTYTIKKPQNLKDDETESRRFDSAAVS